MTNRLIYDKIRIVLNFNKEGEFLKFIFKKMLMAIIHKEEINDYINKNENSDDKKKIGIIQYLKISLNALLGNDDAYYDKKEDSKNDTVEDIEQQVKELNENSAKAIENLENKHILSDSQKVSDSKKNKLNSRIKVKTDSNTVELTKSSAKTNNKDIEREEK